MGDFNSRSILSKTTTRKDRGFFFNNISGRHKISKTSTLLMGGQPTKNKWTNRRTNPNYSMITLGPISLFGQGLVVSFRKLC